MMTLTAIFDDDEDISVDILPSWKRSLGKSNSQQTDEIDYYEISTQTSIATSVEVQTESQDVFQTSDNGCAEFLKRIAPIMLTEIENTTNAFDDYSVQWENEREVVILLHTLKHDFAEYQSFTTSKSKNNENNNNSRPICKAVTVNNLGALVACGYSHLSHSGWCLHSSVICVWNILSRHIQLDKADTILETPCCVTALAFHPENPNLLAAGLFNGQIRIFCISDTEEPLKYTSPVDDLFHREPITALKWFNDRTSTLMSTAGDGKVLWWSTDNDLSYPISGALLTPTEAYHGAGKSNRFPIMGGSALTVSMNRTIYVVGTELGGIVKGIVDALIVDRKKGLPASRFELKWTSAAYSLYNAVELVNKDAVKRHIESYSQMKGLKKIDIGDVFDSRVPAALLYPPVTISSFQSHTGMVTAAIFSPFNPSLFLTASVDKSVRLYHSMRPKQIFSWQLTSDEAPILAITWSTCRPCVFACADARGMIYIYDLLANETEPVQSIQANKNHQAVFSLCWHPKEVSLLTSSDHSGNVNVWQLGTQFSTFQLNENLVLSRFSEGDEDSL